MTPRSPHPLGGRAALVLGALAACAAPAAAQRTSSASPIAAAIADRARPAADTARDATRKPGEVLAFAEVRPGQKIAEFLPATGYFTRLFSRIVGPRGKVYVFGPPGATTTMPGILGAPGYANVRAVTASATSLNVPEPVDIVWTSLNYHDLKNPPRAGEAPIDITAFNKAIYRALKPGGYYVVIDHAAKPGDAAAPSARHRIDQLTVVNEVASVGFLKQSETQALRHPEDPRTASAPPMNGLSDRFVMVFRKPDLSFGGAIRDR